MFVRHVPLGGGHVDQINLDQVTHVRFFKNSAQGTTVRTGRVVAIHFVAAHEPLTLLMTDAQAEEFERLLRDRGGSRVKQSNQYA
jgi:hypothetical protein